MLGPHKPNLKAHQGPRGSRCGGSTHREMARSITTHNGNASPGTIAILEAQQRHFTAVVAGRKLRTGSFESRHQVALVCPFPLKQTPRDATKSNLNTRCELFWTPLAIERALVRNAPFDADSAKLGHLNVVSTELTMLHHCPAGWATPP
jgi:hypothetical protein